MCSGCEDVFNNGLNSECFSPVESQTTVWRVPDVLFLFLILLKNQAYATHSNGSYWCLLCGWKSQLKIEYRFNDNFKEILLLSVLMRVKIAKF